MARKNRKLNKARVFKHMARDASNFYVVRVSRDELLDIPSGEDLIDKYLGRWIRLMKLKHSDVKPRIDIETYDEIDYDRVRIIGRVLPERYWK